MLPSVSLLYYVCYIVLLKLFRWPWAANTFPRRSHVGQSCRRRKLLNPKNQLQRQIQYSVKESILIPIYLYFRQHLQSVLSLHETKGN